ncbi:glycosyl hydrolase [Flavobacterium luteolum]|uniref:glycosyl hydrolase n=1 Tax=Flavobacterium luteolum TaxID=3003259 RepID=UPI00248DEBE9|nr:glycosyl hydrolase [Flavobacterium luteolum]
MGKKLFVFLLLCSLTASYSQTAEKKDWLKSYDISIESFKKPPLDYAPFARWWWPGNDVDKEQLKAEINLFADNNFGGVEIQPMSLVFPTKGKGRADRIMGFDTPLYYENLKAVFEEARKRGVTVDMTDGSGWPAGGDHLTEDDNNLKLDYGIMDIPSGNKNALKIPRAAKGDRPKAKLVALLAAKVLNNPDNAKKSYMLDADSVINITDKVKDSTFIYSPKGSSWKAIALWSIPAMESPMLSAKKNAGFVMNHFDSTKVKKSLNYLFGERTGMTSYFGNPFRSVFDDSFEFKVERHFSEDFTRFFKANRGYDAVKYLPANIWLGYNCITSRLSNPEAQPDFIYSEEDWRLRYDYDLTLSELLVKHFFKPANLWAESRGLLHRTQGYGVNMDMIAAAGETQIPEMETMQFNIASEGGFKIISSGAHLYNRPVVSCESAVYSGREFMTTPQKLKMLMDKAFCSGVNQIIWHGVPYQYSPEGYPKEGWYPFFNSGVGIRFSTNMGTANPYWKYMKSINQYGQRVQYAMRSGKAQADVLVYFPFLSYSQSAANPSEVLLKGYMKDVEPPLSAEISEPESYNQPSSTEWLQKIWPLLNELNSKGITWDWINDASVQELKATSDKKISIKGNVYQSIVLFDPPFVQLKSAENLKKLSKAAVNILMVGSLAKKQPSFNNYRKNDQLTEKLIAETSKAGSTKIIEINSSISSWSETLDIPVRYADTKNNLRQARRLMSDGSLLQFIWNQSEKWQRIDLKLSPEYKNAYWMDAESGLVKPGMINGKNETGYLLPPFSTIILNASLSPIQNLQTAETAGFNPENARALAAIDKWDIKSGPASLNNSGLFDWKSNADFKHSSELGEYTATFTLADADLSKSYFLDLGRVCFSADVIINDKPVSSMIFSPYVCDITNYIRPGLNKVKVVVTPTKFNEFAGLGSKGDKLYKLLKDSELMSQGLLGPVHIYEQKKQ